MKEIATRTRMVAEVCRDAAPQGRGEALSPPGVVELLSVGAVPVIELPPSSPNDSVVLLQESPAHCVTKDMRPLIPWMMGECCSIYGVSQSDAKAPGQVECDTGYHLKGKIPSTGQVWYILCHRL